MDNKPKPVVGQKLYSLNIGNAVSKYSPPKLIEMVVTKVGRKYFTCKGVSGYPEYEYCLEDWEEHTEYCRCSKLYESADIYEREKEIDHKHRVISDHFSWNSRRLPDDVICKMYDCIPAEYLPKKEGTTP